MADQLPIDNEAEPRYEDAIDVEDAGEAEAMMAEEVEAEEEQLEMEEGEEEFHLAEEDLQLDDEDGDEEADEQPGDQIGAAAGFPALLRLFPRRLAWPQQPEPDDASSAMEAANAPHLITFNRQLPREHAYLGGDLEAPSNVSTSTVNSLADSGVIELPCLTCSLGILLPGQLLPVALFRPSDVALVSGMHSGQVGPVAVLHRYRYSSTAELLSCREEVDDNVGLTMIRAKLIGRRRFEALSVRRDIAGRLLAKIRLLPEPKQMSPCSFRRPSPRRSLALSTCPFPSWVADAYDARQLVSAVRTELASCNRSWSEVQTSPPPLPTGCWSSCPCQIGSALTCSAALIRPAAFAAASVLLRRCTTLRCVRCLNRVADKSAIFCLAAGGSTGAYVNPGGHVHEMMTVAAATGVRPVGRPCTEHSWFPGYAWQILECAQCSRHMGWRFSAQSSDTRPAAFYGLCRSSVQPDLTASLEEERDNPDEAQLAELEAGARVQLRSAGLGAAGPSFADGDDAD
uniref:Protein cereblon n=1 Tax=Macrostomum lignano TaxID=282301 RepID=A0A1I8GM55_9PLAT